MMLLGGDCLKKTLARLLLLLNLSVKPGSILTCSCRLLLFLADAVCGEKGTMAKNKKRSRRRWLWSSTCVIVVSQRGSDSIGHATTCHFEFRDERNSRIRLFYHCGSTSQRFRLLHIRIRFSVN